MRELPILAIIVAGILLWGALNRTETFVPEFLEQSGVRRTVGTNDSSYAQQTNHMPQPGGTAVPIQGVESAYRVNAYNSYVV